MHRLMSTEPSDMFEAVCAGNAGWYSLPSLEQGFPAGLGGIGATDADVVRLLAFPLLILAGEQDIATSGPSLPAQPAAIAQGPHRFARAKNYLAVGQAEAARRKVACNWRLVSVPHIGHDGAAMSRACASLWFDGALPGDKLLAEWGKAKDGAL